jgi:hypothetical protein
MGESHTVQAAMERGELTEDEAYFVLRFAGRVGYDKAIKRLAGRPLHKLRKWLVWFGGWEHPELSQWDRGVPAWEFRRRNEFSGKVRWLDPFPLSLFGGRVTFFSWGFQVKVRRGWLVASGAYANSLPTKLYWSPNGTPQHERARFFVGSDRRCA